MPAEDELVAILARSSGLRRADIRRFTGLGLVGGLAGLGLEGEGQQCQRGDEEERACRHV